MKKIVNMKEWSGILIYIENNKQIINPVSLELIGEAFRLSKVTKSPIYGVAIGESVERLKEQLKGTPLKEVFLYETTEEFKADVYEKAVEKCIQALKPSVVLIGGTSEGRALAPRLAVHFKTGLTADCTELSMNEDEGLIQTRPAFGGNIMASIITENTRPQFATVRAKIMSPMEMKMSTEIKYHIETLENVESSISILDVKKEVLKKGLENQNVLIVAGRGIRKKEDLYMLQELADLLGGKLASSRALVEKGWMTPREQIGLSGNTVSPKLMITCGVSGTIQFMAGMKGTKNIVAINSDENARIFEIAHYPICSDLYEVIPELIKLLKTNDL